MSEPNFDFEPAEQPWGEIERAPDATMKLQLGVTQDQLTRALAVIQRQQAVIAAAKLFIDALTMLNPKGEGPLFVTTADDPLAVATFNHRYTDLSMLLNGEGHAVPPKLNIGVTH